MGLVGKACQERQEGTQEGPRPGLEGGKEAGQGENHTAWSPDEEGWTKGQGSGGKDGWKSGRDPWVVLGNAGNMDSGQTWPP